MDNLHILIVEDNRVERDLMTSIITGLGYKNVTAVRSAEAALKALRGSSDNYFLIFLDLNLPGGMNGVEFAEEVNVEYGHKGIDIILVSGHPDRVLQTIQASVFGAVDGYIEKPVKPDLIASHVEMAKKRLAWVEALVLQGTRDHLTGAFGVLNRAEMEKQLELEMNRAKHSDDKVRLRRLNGEDVLGSHLAVAIFDIDNFKSFNDTYGHAAGDEVLQEFARRVSVSDRSSDDLGRWGGDEFLLKAPECAEKSLDTMLKRIKRGIEEIPFELSNGEKVVVTTSIGGAVNTFEKREEGEGIVDLIKRADQALYRAKEKGRNRVSII